ncbi:MAG TPA: hotdog domain-containing protein [Mycobacteriales bacterium]|jgi:predicted thioesterase|nr:hotdog domain-containing protein [Mycobacteriales bacterium]
MTLQVGLTGRAGLTVTEQDTAAALGSGDVDVLGTPRVVALAERATVAALGGHLADPYTSVGTRVELDHRVPTPVGGTVQAEAHLVSVNGRKLAFAVVVRDDGAQTVAEGRIERVVVDRTRFGRA